jgi:hypothetical protein
MRKVRTAGSADMSAGLRATVLANSKAARKGACLPSEADGKCNRKKPPGEMQYAECRSQNEDKVNFVLHSSFIVLHFLRQG